MIRKFRFNAANTLNSDHRINKRFTSNEDVSVTYLYQFTNLLLYAVLILKSDMIE